MNVAIVGAAGKMGSWFARYFVQTGHEVTAFDVRPARLQGVRSAKSVAECVMDADLAVVCVPVQLTPAMVKQCAASMKPGSAIAEISSVKHRTFAALKKVRHLTTLCIHPMFGPGADQTRQLRMLVVPVRDRASELAAVQEAFPGMSFKVLKDAGTHDRAIAAVLGMTYFVNAVFASMLAKEKIAALKEVGGTTFALQSMLAESVMTDEPELIAALLRDNPHSARYIRRYLKDAQELSRLASGDSRLQARLKRIRSGLQKQQDIQASYRRMYEILGRL
jgi:prephenate dehydrogenase